MRYVVTYTTSTGDEKWFVVAKKNLMQELVVEHNRLASKRMKVRTVSIQPLPR